MHTIVHYMVLLPGVMESLQIGHGTPGGTEFIAVRKSTGLDKPENLAPLVLATPSPAAVRQPAAPSGRSKMSKHFREAEQTEKAYQKQDAVFVGTKRSLVRVGKKVRHGDGTAAGRSLRARDATAGVRCGMDRCANGPGAGKTCA